MEDNRTSALSATMVSIANGRIGGSLAVRYRYTATTLAGQHRGNCLSCLSLHTCLRRDRAASDDVRTLLRMGAQYALARATCLGSGEPNAQQLYSRYIDPTRGKFLDARGIKLIAKTLSLLHKPTWLSLIVATSGLLAQEVSVLLENRRRSGMDWEAVRERVCIGLVALVHILFSCHGFLHAQDNYEMQVYPSKTIAPKTLMTELHSNGRSISERAGKRPHRRTI